MKKYLHSHWLVFRKITADLLIHPLRSLNTIILIAISLFIPLLFYVFIQTLSAFSSQWEGQAQVSVFLQHKLTNHEAQLIFEELQLLPVVKTAAFINAEQGLKEFEALSQSKVNLTFLEKNPIPASIIIVPDTDLLNNVNLPAWKKELESINGIDFVRIDIDWIEHFQTFTYLVKKISSMVSISLIIACVFTVSHHIRLLVSHKKQEIKITQLIGGSAAYIQRPFLHFGTLFGVLGALFALAFLYSIYWAIQPSLHAFIEFYTTPISIYHLSFVDIIYTLLFGGCLGWVSTKISLWQHFFSLRAKI